MKTLNYVQEYHSIDTLQQFLNVNNKTEKYIIKKIFRSPDGVYLVWFQDLEVFKPTEE